MNYYPGTSHLSYPFDSFLGFNIRIWTIWTCLVSLSFACLYVYPLVHQLEENSCVLSMNGFSLMIDDEWCSSVLCIRDFV